jgi:sialate O-acetylesterase
MIAPLVPYAIKGVIWYQGENNAASPALATEYRTLFPAMIKDWRGLWNEGDFPFLYVQLANFNRPGDGWPMLRESQSKTLALPKTGMAVIIDIGTGDNIHPPDKADVGARLALAARHVAYGQNLVFTGPVYRAMKVEGSAIQLSFDKESVGGGLIVGSAPWVDPKAEPVSKTELQGFEIAGEDKKWVEAQARIDGNTITVSSPLVPKPVAVRYAWASNPRCNLYNREGLPASPFRTDDWN